MMKKKSKVKIKKGRKIKTSKLSFAAQKKNLDLMKLLVSDSEFQSIVKETRDYLNIPSDGFSNDGAIKQWTHEMDQISDTMIDSKKFLVQEEKIRSKLQSKEIGMRIAREQSKLLYHKIPWNYLNNTDKFVVDKFNLPVHFTDSIKSYIIRGVITAPCNNFTGGEYPSWTLLSKVRYFPIKIYSKLTDTEFEDLKKYIKCLSEKLPKFKPLKNIDRRLTIEEWYHDRVKFDIVEEKEYTLTLSEIAENLLRDKRLAKKIYDIVRELKELRERRFREKDR